jgi:hypothetical protein
MSWLGRSVVWADDDGKYYGGIVCMDNQSMNEVLITIFKPWRTPETVRGYKQDGPWDPSYRNCWLAKDYHDA